MKRSLIAILALTLGASAVYAADTTTLTSDNDKISYALGVNLGHLLQSNGVDIKALNHEAMVKGMNDYSAGSKLLLTDAEITATMTKYQTELKAKRLADIKAQSATNTKEGADFIAKYKAEAGVKTLPSGIAYKVITEGTGEMPVYNDSVIVDYEGKLINGKVFDSSIARGEPAPFILNNDRIIKGWIDMLTAMKVGSTVEAVIPAELAYGERGSPSGIIGPNATLIFKIHLISVKKPETAAAATPAVSTDKK